MRMYYLGIIGALSSLGQGVIAKLNEHPSEFKIVFKVDDRYPKNNLLSGEFRNLEQVLTHNINPTVVLDFGIAGTVFERAKFYRDYAMPAIMQCAFGNEKSDILRNTSTIAGNDYAPLILIPDFSIIKVLIMKNLKGLLNCFASDVQRIRIDILYNTERYNNQNQWLYWANVINEVLGKPTNYYREQGNTLDCGLVQYGFMRINSLDKNEESINLQIFNSQKDTIFRYEMQYNLLSSRINGAMKVLDWYLYQDHHKPRLNNLFSDMLTELV